MAVGYGDVCHGVLREEDGGARTMGKGGGETDETRGGGRGTQNRGRGGRRGGMAMGSLVLGVIGGELASWRGAAATAITAAATATARAAIHTRKLADHQRAAKRDEGDRRRCRGETCGNSDRAGATMMPAFEIFSSPRILSGAKTSP
jgi:hypothetical protein